MVNNFDDVEKIWRHAFSNELRVDPSTIPVLLSESVPSASGPATSRWRHDATGICRVTAGTHVGPRSRFAAGSA